MQHDMIRIQFRARGVFHEAKNPGFYGFLAALVSTWCVLKSPGGIITHHMFSPSFFFFGLRKKKRKEEEAGIQGRVGFQDSKILLPSPDFPVTQLKIMRPCMKREKLSNTPYFTD